MSNKVPSEKGNITPIFKKGKKGGPWRSTNLNSMPSKIMEQILLADMEVREEIRES